MTSCLYISGPRKAFGLSVTPATGSRGPTNPVIRITPSSVTHSDQQRTGSVQTNLFGGTPDDPAAEFCRYIRQLAAELRAEIGEEQRVSGDEDDPVTGNPIREEAADKEEEDEDDADEEDKDEEEEEDPGYGNSRDDDEDDDSPPASLHRPVTQSTPKKKPISRSKRKAYRNQLGPGSSSRKQTRTRDRR